MWAESIEKVRNKFRALRDEGWNGYVVEDAASFDEIKKSYEDLAWEMVEGISTLLLQMIENQHYVSRKVPTLDQKLYSQAHKTMMEVIEEAVAEEVTTMPQFFGLVHEVIQQLHGYSKLLKQDLQRNYMRFLYPRPDRRYRQINITLRDIIEAFDRMQERNTALMREMAGDIPEQSIQKVAEEKEDLKSLIDEDMFSEEERELLRKLMEE